MIFLHCRHRHQLLLVGIGGNVDSPVLCFCTSYTFKGVYNHPTDNRHMISLIATQGNKCWTKLITTVFHTITIITNMKTSPITRILYEGIPFLSFVICQYIPGPPYKHYRILCHVYVTCPNTSIGTCQLKKSDDIITCQWCAQENKSINKFLQHSELRVLHLRHATS
jgi:hypothetical protein